MNNSAIGGTWDELERELFTPEEIAASNLHVAMMGELLKGRQEQGINADKLEEMTGVKRSVISKMERCDDIPQLEAVLKVLATFGKTLAVVPIQPE
ncbi:MAG: helix-turn-helix transcriptional regulator [Oscillospiraceae bacterium]|nr:helix-turn-helix transcriptional regulator [Oscillospiraceae bacterium]